jgi:hypothetical protein
VTDPHGLYAHSLACKHTDMEQLCPPKCDAAAICTQHATTAGVDTIMQQDCAVPHLLMLPLQ